MSYYKQINKIKYDRGLLERADELTSGQGDGRIGKADAVQLWEDAQDGKGVTACERRTLEYIVENYNCTEPASKELRKLLDHDEDEEVTISTKPIRRSSRKAQEAEAEEESEEEEGTDEEEGTEEEDANAEVAEESEEEEEEAEAEEVEEEAEEEAEESEEEEEEAEEEEAEEEEEEAEEEEEEEEAEEEAEDEAEEESDSDDAPEEVSMSGAAIEAQEVAAQEAKASKMVKQSEKARRRRLTALPESEVTQAAKEKAGAKEEEEFPEDMLAAALEQEEQAKEEEEAKKPRRKRSGTKKRRKKRNVDALADGHFEVKVLPAEPTTVFLSGTVGRVIRTREELLEGGNHKRVPASSLIGNKRKLGSAVVFGNDQPVVKKKKKKRGKRVAKVDPMTAWMDRQALGSMDGMIDEMDLED